MHAEGESPCAAIAVTASSMPSNSWCRTTAQPSITRMVSLDPSTSGVPLRRRVSRWRTTSLHVRDYPAGQITVRPGPRPPRRAASTPSPNKRACHRSQGRTRARRRGSNGSPPAPSTRLWSADRLPGTRPAHDGHVPALRPGDRARHDSRDRCAKGLSTSPTGTTIGDVEIRPTPLTQRAERRGRIQRWQPHLMGRLAATRPIRPSTTSSSVRASTRYSTGWAAGLCSTCEGREESTVPLAEGPMATSTTAPDTKAVWNRTNSPEAVLSTCSPRRRQ